MALLHLRNITLENGDNLLFDQLNLQIEAGERLCLVGRNGTGKSTLMKLLEREIVADNGEIIHSPGLLITRLQQDVPVGTDTSVFEVVASGFGEVAELLRQYHQINHELGEQADEQTLNRLFEVQQQMEAQNAWQLEQRVETVLSKLQLDPDASFQSLSGGWKRRALLAKALVGTPDLLLLDEPTNHLDIPAIEWLESYLLNFSGTLLFVSHDRSFVRKLATRIIELDRGQLTSWSGNFDQYLVAKQAALDAEATQNALFDKRLAEEEVWIRQGIKARRTRNEGRVRRLEALREEFKARRYQQGATKANIEQASQSGKQVVVADNLTYQLDNGRTLIRDFNSTILRGDKVGIIGPNGVGKTTLIKLLLGQLAPSAGQVNLGTKLEIAYFDQYRDQFDDEQNLRENIAPKQDFIEIDGRKQHVISYLQNFLFSSLQIQKPVKVLSGGERNRLLLARIFSRPSNLLVLDEPTNDLDAETLELLEELLVEYKGTVLLISHDRSFLNSVVTRSLVFEEGGRIGEYAGGYDDWLAQRPVPNTNSNNSKSSPKADKATKPSPSASTTAPVPAKPKKLSFKDQRELEQLPLQIEQFEAELVALQVVISAPTFYQQSNDAVSRKQSEYQALESKLAKAYARWEELEAMLG